MDLVTRLEKGIAVDGARPAIVVGEVREEEEEGMGEGTGGS